MIYISINPKPDNAEKDARALLALLESAMKGNHLKVSSEYARRFNHEIKCYSL